jgi:hypothetical protein
MRNHTSKRSRTMSALCPAIHSRYVGRNRSRRLSSQRRRLPMLKKCIIFTALAGLAFTVIIPAPAYAGKCYRHKHLGIGKSISKKLAINIARAEWRSGVIKHGHPSSILWKNSRNQKQNCSRSRRSWQSPFVYKCWAVASPCTTTVTDQGVLEDLAKRLPPRISR